MTAVTTVSPRSGEESMPSGGPSRNVAVIATCVLLLAAIAGALGFWRYAATYAPLDSGFYFGPYRSADLPKIVQHQTDLGEEVYLKGVAGTEAAVITELVNDGSHDVTIRRIVRNSMIADIEWSPYTFRPGGDIAGVALPLRRFPASVPAHSQIRVVITLRKPPCNGGTANFDQLPVYWHALGVDHLYMWPFAIDTTYVGCPLHPA